MTCGIETVVQHQHDSATHAAATTIRTTTITTRATQQTEATDTAKVLNVAEYWNIGNHERFELLFHLNFLAQPQSLELDVRFQDS